MSTPARQRFEIASYVMLEDERPIKTTPIRATSSRSDWQTATILAIEPQTPRISSVFLAPERPFGFIPGQHISVRTTGSSAARKYSIASAPESGAILELAVEALPGGEVSGYFHRSAAPGDTISIRGPHGRFTWSVVDGGPVLWIGAGSGLAPLMSMIRHRTLRRSSIPAGLIYSASTWDDVLFRDELFALAAASGGFELTLTLTRQPVARAGVASRRVDSAMLADMLQRFPRAVGAVFICGSEPFVNHVEALAAPLIGPGRVRTESYGS